MATALVPSVRRRRTALSRLRPNLHTTPARLRLAAVAILVAALTFGVLGETAATTRRDAARKAATESEPLLLRAVQLHDALSDADATASATFVIGGAEPSTRRRRYMSDIAAASAALAVLGRRTDTSPETAGAVAAIGRELPVYTGLIESARANNRQRLPVGAAYLRRASALMRGRILPAAAHVYTFQGRLLSRRYQSGASAGAVALFFVAALVVIAVLVAVQTYFTRLTHRRLNLPLLAGTLVFGALAAWGLLGLTAERRALLRAQRNGSDPVEVLSAVRALALRAQADEGLSLTARGSGEVSVADFETTLSMLGVSRGGGLLAAARELEAQHGSEADVRRLSHQFDSYQRVHARVLSLESQGAYSAAANLSVGTSGRELLIADSIGRTLDRLIAASQRRFEVAAAEARSAVRGLWLGIPLLTFAGALLGLYGARQRMSEYR
jgi:hypothetical protein